MWRYQAGGRMVTIRENSFVTLFFFSNHDFKNILNYPKMTLMLDLTEPSKYTLEKKIVMISQFLYLKIVDFQLWFFLKKTFRVIVEKYFWIHVRLIKSFNDVWLLSLSAKSTFKIRILLFKLHLQFLSGKIRWWWWTKPL